jgi:hypothetical protein
MIKSLSKIFNGLSAQYAGEYLSSSEKDQIISNYPRKSKPLIASHHSEIILPNQLRDEKRRIALLCNDTTNQNVINYVLGNANDCSVDILYHGPHKIIPSDSFYKYARSSFSDNDVDVSIVKLINDSIEEVKDYLLSHRTLQYLVTDSHDQLISSFLNNKSITRQLQIPIVLIN